MADRVTSPSDGRPADELRAYLADELDAESLAAFDSAQQLWDSGELRRIIDEGDFSDLPDEARPEE